MTTTTPSQTKPQLPPSSKIPPILIAIWAILDQFGTLERFQKKLGDIFYTRKSSWLPPYAIFSDPQAIEKVLTADPDLFEVGEESSAPVRVLLGENSLVVLNGQQHHRHRKLLMPPFHGERMKRYGQTIVDTTKKVIASWQVDQTIYIRDYTQEISLQVILKTIFGLDSGQRYDRLKAILVDYIETFNSPLRSFFLLFPWLQKDLGWLTPWHKFLEQRQLIRDILQEECDRRRANPELLGEDILSLLLSARDEDGQPMSDAEIRDELMTMLFAGHETTASSLAWSCYWLHRSPEIGEKLQVELNSLADSEDFSAIAKLPYLSAIVSETLRLNPVVVFLSRQLKKPLELMGYKLEPGTSLFPCIYLVHQREDLYPEPKEFKPERFITRQYSPYEFFPFGGGHRRCLGYAFALYEMKLVLATFMSRVQFELLDDRPLRTTRRGFTFSPQSGIKMRIKEIN